MMLAEVFKEEDETILKDMRVYEEFKVEALKKLRNLAEKHEELTELFNAILRGNKEVLKWYKKRGAIYGY